MSVFTEIQRPELESFLLAFELGRLHGFRGIAEGTENSNFFVSLDTGEFVLTLVERGEHADLPFTVTLLEQLHQAGLPVPFALRNQQGQAILQLAGKPALLQPRLPGKHILQPNAQHCAAVGQILARMHLATRERPIEHPSDRGLPWMLEQGAELAEQLAAASLQLLDASLQDARELQTHWARLPQANLHADLFRDNVLFDGPHLSGMIDFYNACSGPMLYDVAIAMLDWCPATDGTLDARLMRTLLAAYAGLRPFTQAEELHWPLMVRVACLRFWLSRLLAARAPGQTGVKIKPPEEFEQRLQQLTGTALNLPLAL
jgi:homoserine kinase type II